jgi:hypothetical protein
MVLTVVLCLATLAFATGSPHAPLGGYYPVSNVIEHSQIAQDVADFTLALDAYNFEDARNIYTNGRYSCKTAVVRRTLQGFVAASTVPKLRGVEFYEHFVGNQSGSMNLSLTFWDDIVIQALNGTGPFLGRNPSFRRVVLQKSVLGLVTLYGTYEMESSMAKASTPSERTDSGAGHAWDEGWAFMYGSFSAGQYSPWESLKKRDLDFAFKSSQQIPGTIAGSVDIVSHFQQGLHAIRNDTFSAQVLQEARDNIYRLLALNAIRNVLKYGYRATQRMDGTTSYNADYHAEAFTYFLPGAGWIERATPGTAKSILQLIPLDQNISNSNLYCDLQRILIPAYSSLGLDCAMVGTWKDLPSNVSCTNLPACPPSASLPKSLPGYLPTNVSTAVGTNLDCDPLYPFPVQSTVTTTTSRLPFSSASSVYFSVAALVVLFLCK